MYLEVYAQSEKRDKSRRSELLWWCWSELKCLGAAEKRGSNVSRIELELSRIRHPWVFNSDFRDDAFDLDSTTRYRLRPTIQQLQGLDGVPTSPSVVVALNSS